MASKILTYNQAVVLSDRQDRSSIHLLNGSFNGQAVARGYYSVFTLVSFVVFRRPDWPMSKWRDGTDRQNVSHEDVPKYVEMALYVTQGHSLAPRQARVDATELLSQRVAADYFGYQDISDSMARRLLGNCSAIRSVLMDTAKLHQTSNLR